MKKSLLLIPFLLIAAVVNGQWIQNSSCDKKANIVANQAIEYMANLEYLSALGAANSALLLDENCGCAKLTLAAISSQNPKWGSRIQKLDEIDTSKLTAEEKAWYNYLRIVDNLKRPEFQITIQNKFPKSPLINYLGTSVNDFNSYKLFAEKFPTYSSSAYNMISYGYMMGAFGEINMEEAKKYIEMSKNMHFGPNSFDSMGEHYASVGDYEKALESQLTAIDFATFASPYYTNAQLYSAKMSKDKISQTIMDNQKVMQSAILNGDYESYKEFEHPEIVVTTGDSNLNPFYVFTKDNLDEDAPMTWNAFNLSNFEVYFSPDMKSSVITFDADGSFTMIDSKIKIDYSTRGSATWVSTTEGWKILHSSYAPRKGKNGLPDVN
jgi:hypothetical protein